MRRLLLSSLIVLGTGCGLWPPADSSPAKPGLPSSEAEVSGDAAPSDDLREALHAIGYVEGTVDNKIENTGVVLYDEARAWPGLNFFYSRKKTEAHLLDMQGRIVHTWSYDTKEPWQHVTLVDDGSLIILCKDDALFRIDKDSNLLWTVKERVHHDLDVFDGKVISLSRRLTERPDLHPKYPLLEDILVSFDLETGERLGVESVQEMIDDSQFEHFLPHHLSGNERIDNRYKMQEYDLLHVNHVEVFDGRLADKSPLFARGNRLLSLRNIHLIMIVDAEGEPLWGWGGSNLIFQHHPTLLDNGHILVFNNGIEYSTILEVDPLTDEVVWRWQSQRFFSEARGSVQRLPNGNTLITESDKGYVFEVTPKGDIVWRFANPDKHPRRRMRMAIWRMLRYDPAELSWLTVPPEDQRGFTGEPYRR